MNEIEYVVPLSDASEDRLRIRATRWRGRILAFVVQYEIHARGEWTPVVRYDTTHGYCHRDLLHPDGRVEKHPFPGMEFSAGFTWALQDLQSLWPVYREQYLREVKP